MGACGSHSLTASPTHKEERRKLDAARWERGCWVFDREVQGKLLEFIRVNFCAGGKKDAVVQGAESEVERDERLDGENRADGSDVDFLVDVPADVQEALDREDEKARSASDALREALTEARLAEMVAA